MSFFDDLGQEEAPVSGREKRRTRPGGRTAVFAIVAVFVVLVSGYVGLAAYAGDTVPRRVSVHGVELQGRTAEAAEDYLRQRFEPLLAAPQTFTHKGDVQTLVPAAAGISIDYFETVRRAGAVRSWSPERLWDWLSRGDDVEPVFTVDKLAFDKALNTITSSFSEQAVEGTITFDTGKAVPVQGKPGLRVASAPMLELVKTGLFRDETPELPVETSEPYITKEDVRRAMESFGQPAMSAPVVITIGPKRVIASPQQLGQAITMIPSGGALKPVIDGKKLMQTLAPTMKTVSDKPRNAGVSVVKGALVKQPEVIGAAWDPAEIAKALPEVLTKRPGDRELTLQAAITRPKVTDEAVAKWGITKRVAGFRVRTGAPDRSLKAALEALHNTHVKPGATVSLLSVISGLGLGPQAPALGGAVFNAAYDAGLVIDQRWSAQARDSRFPAGREIAFGAAQDLMFSNNTPWSILISAEESGAIVTVGLWSTPYYSVNVKTSKPFNVVASTATADTSGKCKA